MELLEKLKKNYDKYSDNIIQKCNATKTIVSGMNSDRNLVYDPIVIKSEYLVSASLKNDF